MSTTASSRLTAAAALAAFTGVVSLGAISLKALADVRSGRAAR